MDLLDKRWLQALQSGSLIETPGAGQERELACHLKPTSLLYCYYMQKDPKQQIPNYL